MRIALKYKVPIVPTATVGFHKISPLLNEERPEHGPPEPTMMLPIPLPFKAKIEFGNTPEGIKKLNQLYPQGPPRTKS